MGRRSVTCQIIRIMPITAYPACGGSTLPYSERNLGGEYHLLVSRYGKIDRFGPGGDMRGGHKQRRYAPRDRRAHNGRNSKAMAAPAARIRSDSRVITGTGGDGA
jgi:hypothetical protein